MKKRWRDRISVALVYPNTYRVAMANLGFHTVYNLFNLHDDVVCERVVLPAEGAAPRSIESARALKDFDVVAFSFSFEPDALNILRLLDAAGLPLRSAEERAPLIMMGGVAATLNPEPLADFMDVIALGEAEVIVPQFLSAYRKGLGKPKRDLLMHLREVRGLYIPAYYEVRYNSDSTIAGRENRYGTPEKIVRRYTADLNDARTHTRIYTDDAEFSDMSLVEVARGCARGCRFCAAGFVYRPPRFAPLERLAEMIEEGLKDRERIGLVAAVAADHPEFEKLRGFILQRGATFSVASQRIDAMDDVFLHDLLRSGQKTLTLAPEAGTEHLRNVINKPISDRTILGLAERIGASGLRSLKLYLMIGLPGETAEDVEGIGELVKAMRAALAKGAGTRRWAGRLSLSINPFIPKPVTPFQWHPMAPREILTRTIARIRESLKREPGLEIRAESPRQAILQGLLSRGDRRVGDFLSLLHRHQARMTNALKEWDADPVFYLTRQRQEDEILPWDFIDHGCTKSFLSAEYRKALLGKTTPACKIGKCKTCGACRI